MQTYQPCPPNVRTRHGRIKFPTVEVVGAWAQRYNQGEDRKEDMRDQEHIEGRNFPRFLHHLGMGYRLIQGNLKGILTQKRRLSWRMIK